MKLTDEEKEEARQIVKFRPRDKWEYMQREKKFYRKMLDKYGENIASEVLFQMWKARTDDVQGVL